MVDEHNDTGGPEVIDAEPLGEDGSFQVRPQPALRRVRRGSLQLTTGAVLLTIGAMMVAMRLWDSLDRGGVVLIVGAALLVAWAFRATYGLLIPGAIMTALGVGDVVAVSHGQGADWISLGIGFIAIVVLDYVRVRDRHWWPLVPGAVLIAAGLMQSSSLWDRLSNFLWPLVLILLGLLLVIAALARRGKTTT